MKKRIAVLLGDGAGIGPEQVAKCAISGFLTEHCDPIILGDKRIFDRALRIVGGEEYSYTVIENFEDMKFNGQPIFYDMKNLDPADFKIGTVNLYTGKATVEQIDLAIQMWRDKLVGAILFAPFNKASIKAYKGDSYNSELSYMREVLHYTGFSCEINHMQNVFTTRITSHIPVSEIAKHIKGSAIKDATRLLWNTMRNAGYERPRIAIAALNPHCGEYGTCGREEIDVIMPAVQELVEEGIPCVGPISADTLFNRAFNHDEFDGIVTLYHDQGQIALKLLGFERGVSIQGGLPCPITTPSHGTAFEIAGTGKASIDAFNSALLDAVAMAGKG